MFFYKYQDSNTRLYFTFRYEEQSQEGHLNQFMTIVNIMNGTNYDLYHIAALLFLVDYYSKKRIRII